MIAMPTADARLMAHQSGDLLELLTVHVTVAVQIEHAEGNLEMTTRSFTVGKSGGRIVIKMSAINTARFAKTLFACARQNSLTPSRTS